MQKSLPLFIVVVLALSHCTIPQPTQVLSSPTVQSPHPLQFPISLPAGFTISIYTDNVPGARSLAITEDGILFVGTKEQGKVYAVLPSANATYGGQVLTLASGLNLPNGIAYSDDTLYVTEVNRVLAYKHIHATLGDLNPPTVVTDTLPFQSDHGWRYTAIGPDNALYISIGAPCNVCLTNPPFASIIALNLDDFQSRIVATGVRNSIGFDWYPKTNRLWFTDNGQDYLGDNLPPDEVNEVVFNGEHFGFPYCFGSGQQDPRITALFNCKTSEPPRYALDAHVAPLGMKFYTGSQFPQEYTHKLFIAEHGSWNSSKKIGYRISVIDPEITDKSSYQIFADGWLNNGLVFGRPVDFSIALDGALLISDDFSGVIYRIAYNSHQ